MEEDFLTQAFISLGKRFRTFRGPRSLVTEDSLQDAFCKLWGGNFRFGSEREAEALLSRTSRNIAIDEYRKTKRRPVESLEGKQVADEPSGTEDMEALFRKVETSVNQDLSEIQRLIVRRHEYEGVAFEKIAEELNMQPAAVRMQISRARKAIRDKFRNEYEDR